MNIFPKLYDKMIHANNVRIVALADGAEYS